MKTIVNQMIAHKVAELLLSIGAVTISTDKPFRYTSGILAPIYTDNRLLISHIKIWQMVLQAFEKVIKHTIGLNNIDMLSGTATAAIPHASALAIKLGIPMIYVRTSSKKHGKTKQIEGTLNPGARVLVIEDLVSTGKSLHENVSAVRRAGGKVNACLAITTSTLSAFQATIRTLNIRLITLTDIQTVIKSARKVHLITAQQSTMIKSFLHDPHSWGKRMGFKCK